MNKRIALKTMTIIFLNIFSGCSLIHFLSVDDKRPAETKAVYNNYLSSLHIDTANSLQLLKVYHDSLSIERYALNTYKVDHGGKASPVQIRMYNAKGELSNGWELCFGDLSKFGMMKTVPMQRVSWLPVNYNLTLKNDLNLLNATSDFKQNILMECSKYDYVIMVFYAKWVGWYSKNALYMVDQYIKQNKQYKFLFIKVNSSPSHTSF